MTATEFENYPRSKSASPVHFNVISIAKIGGKCENEILTSISFLSFLCRKMVKISGLGTDLGQ